MTLVFNEKGLSQCNFPCVVQSFVNHNAVLYKLFAIGEESFMVERPSIKNLFASEGKILSFSPNCVSISEILNTANWELNV
jgi:inositol-1,3,4-trisphosphate 5/6-kinase/inositol-tetrakisphosphate 1-kinase